MYLIPYFVTTNLRGWFPYFHDHTLAEILEETIWYSRRIHRCVLYAYVIMPDHLHLLVQPTRTTISQIMHAIKINSSRDVHRSMHSRGIVTAFGGIPPSLRKRGGGNTSAMENLFQWQQSFYDHIIKANVTSVTTSNISATTQSTPLEIHVEKALETIKAKAR